MTDEKSEIRNILGKYKTIAVVGLSANPSKDSYIAAEYLKKAGYNIIPINPNADVVLGEKSYKSLLEMSDELKKTVEVIDIFRPKEEVQPIINQAVKLREDYGKPSVIWMQIGIVNEKAAEQARKAGLTVIMNRCMMTEHHKLKSEENDDLELRMIRMKKIHDLTNESKGNGKNAQTPVAISDAEFDNTVKQHPLVLIDCWAAWCGPCRMIAPVINELARDYHERVFFAKLNTDENPRTCERFGIMSIPTLLFMKNGEEVDRIIGAVPRSNIEETLQKHLS